MAERFESPFVASLETFKTVAAGHAATAKPSDGPVNLLGEVDESGKVRSILKLMDEHEYEIYALIADSYHSDSVCEVVPKFHGVAEKSDGQGNVHKYIRIENVLHGFQDPKVLDVKLGCRSFLESEGQNKKGRPDLFKRMLDMYPEVVTDAEKEARTITKARFMSVRDQNSTLGTLGYRIDGIGGIDKEQKKTIKALASIRTQEDTEGVFGKFCELAAMVPDSTVSFVTPAEIARHFHQRMTRLHATLADSAFVCQHEFIGSSLLFIADRFGHTGVWWIDFAKTYLAPEGIELTHRDPWIQGNHEDGLLTGTETLTKAWDQVTQNLQEVEATWDVNGNSRSGSLGCFSSACHGLGDFKIFRPFTCRTSKAIQKREMVINHMRRRTGSAILQQPAAIDLESFVTRMPSTASVESYTLRRNRRCSVSSVASVISVMGMDEPDESISPTSPARFQRTTVEESEDATDRDVHPDDHIISRYGCSYTFLRDFANDGNNSTMDIAKLRTDVIMSSTSTPERTSFAHMANQKFMLDSDGNHAFADATHFIAHPSQHGLPEVVDAVGCWLTQSGTNPGNVYLWIDVFSMNHHEVNQLPQEFFSTRYLQKIGDIGHTVMILEPWENPVALKRSWVVWELYCTIVTGARLSFTMTHKTRMNFSNALLDSFPSVQTALVNIDLPSCRAVYEHDQEMINKEIMRSMGYAWLSEVTILRLKEWLIVTVQEELEQLHAVVMPKSDEGGRCSCWHLRQRDSPNHHNLFLYFRLKSNLATMLRETGNLAEAESFGWELQAQVERHLGSHHSMAMHCLSEHCQVLQKRGQTEQALTLQRECLKRQRHVNGHSHKDTLQSTARVAVILSNTEPLTLERFTEARELFRLAITQREEVEGVDHPTTLSTVSMYGRLLSYAPNHTDEYFIEAEQLHERAVTGVLAKLGTEAHPLSLTTLHNQAMHWIIRGGTEQTSGLYVRGLKQLQRVADLRTEKLGGQHPDTIETLRALAKARPRKRASVMIRKLQDDQACKELITVNWKQLTLDVFSELNTSAHFKSIRNMLRSFGIGRLRAELLQDGYVDGTTDMLTVGLQPFNVFARMAAGITSQPHMASTQQHLRHFADRYLVASNRPECDENWESASLSWAGKASMSQVHKLLLMKDLYWEWFNVLTYGMVSDLDNGVAKLKEMREAALLWVRECYGEDHWPEKDIGLYLQIHAHTPVTATVLHILDTRYLGPSFHKLAQKILHINDALATLEEEQES